MWEETFHAVFCQLGIIAKDHFWNFCYTFHILKKIIIIAILPAVYVNVEKGNFSLPARTFCLWQSFPNGLYH